VSVQVHRAGIEELDVVEPLWRAMQEHHGELTAGRFALRDPDESWTMRRSEYDGWLADGSGVLFLARATSRADQPEEPDRAGEVAGYAFVRWHPSGPTWAFGQVIGEVESLAVSPSARGAGVGTALLDACRAELRERGLEYWCVDVVESNPAVHLYERAGLKPNYTKLFGRIDG
jgi:ribosomal protein S18 acetylase RimI-like enzyme